MTQSEVTQALWDRLNHARREHPVFARSDEEFLDILDEEFLEVIHAVRDGEGEPRVVSECLDVMAVCMRRILGEVVA